MDFLGKGYAYPMQVAGDGKFRLVQGLNKVRAGIYCILDTPVGTRIGLRDFGCRIHELNFENDEDMTAEVAKFYVQEALNQWEPRIEEITEDNVKVWFEESKMLISITYNVKNYNVEDNIVFPYHIKGAA